MNSKPDPLKKTTRIPFRFKNGKFFHFDDETEITELTEGCIGDIVIENFKITDEARVNEYNVEIEVPFLAKGTKLLARVNESHIPDELKGHLSEERALIGGARVEIILVDDLSLRLRGTKLAKLSDCRCSVPALQGLLTKGKEPRSVSQAFTRISEFFEPHRVSTGGNVFNLVHYYDEKLGWQPLSTLRDRRQIEFERQKAESTR